MTKKKDNLSINSAVKAKRKHKSQLEEAAGLTGSKKGKKKLSDTDSFQRVTKTGKYKVKKRKIHTKTGDIIEKKKKKKVDGGYIW